MKKEAKEKKFEKVTEYYYPDGRVYLEGAIAFYLTQFFVLIVMWIFFPLFFFLTEEYKGTKKTYWKEIK